MEIAIGLLPFPFSNVNYGFPIFVGVGTLLLTMCFVTCRRASATKFAKRLHW